MTTRRRGSWLALLAAIVLGVVLPTVCSLVLQRAFGNTRFEHIPLHSLIESTGGLLAITIASILLVKWHSPRDAETPADHYPWVGAGLIAMGGLDLFHAMAMPGNTFVWLHSLAVCLGGALFGLICLPIRIHRSQLTVLCVVTAGLVALLGLASFLAASSLPEMRSGVQFTAWAKGLNFTGGAGFLAAMIFFVRRFRRSTDAWEDWLFIVISGLFGAAGLLFLLSSLWDSGWWLWHGLRLSGYLGAIVVGAREYLASTHELVRLNRELRDMNRSLDQTVEQRTSKLRASEERFELAVRGSSDGIWDWNIDTNHVYYAPRFRELLGYPDDEFPDLLSSFESHLHEADHAATMLAVERHLRDRIPYDVRYRLRTKSGSYRWFRARGQAVWDEHGRAHRMAGSITDVTAEHRLREHVRLTVEASPAALMMVDAEGRIVLANSAVAELFGFENGELNGQSIELLVPERLRERHFELRRAFFAAPNVRPISEERDLSGRRKDGTEVSLRIGLVPVETESGPACICGILDITAQKHVLESLAQAKTAAEAANRAKSSFLANMSHEIRTPMNGIIGMAHLLGQTSLTPMQHDYLTTIDESAQLLLRLLNDILDFSKIEAGKLDLESVEFPLAECIRRAFQMLALRAEENKLELACRIEPGLPEYVRGDPGRLRQILVNLIGNAIKFTESGEIFVNVTREAVQDGILVLCVSVSDTGVGIPRDKLDAIFSPFEQAESSTTRRFGGSGLGLTISRQLAEMMGGRIWCQSEVGNGSTFSFTARLPVVDRPARSIAHRASLTGLKVLVVDDNHTNRRILGELLTHWGMLPLLSESAQAARHAVETAERERNPVRLVLLDQCMPLESGIEFAIKFRDTPAGKDCPIILISSTITSADLEIARDIGVTRVMSKPVMPLDLLEEISQLMSGNQPLAPPATQLSRNRHNQPRRILLVEDNIVNRRVALGVLQKAGHEVHTAQHGKEALDRLANLEYDLILMDMQMPVMDGYEATREIRAREHASGGHVPIVAMTAEALKDDRERCLATGMDNYLSKPVDPEQLLRVVELYPAICLTLPDASPIEHQPPSAPLG
jgi:PAS domain S-box-containing protein